MGKRTPLGSLTCLALALGICASARVQSCTIFEIADASDVLVGNNEDGTPGTAAYLWFVPATGASLGYVLWGAERAYPEGGMNERGLFFDAAALPERIPIERDPRKHDFTGYLVEPVLQRSSSIESALAFMGRFNLVEQEKAQIFLADDRGDVAIVHANYVVREPRRGPRVLSNHPVVGAGSRAACWRRSAARSLLDAAPITLATIVTTLAATAQRDPSNATNYSQALDLGRRRFDLFWARDFAHPLHFDLPAELAKGARTISMAALFPRSLRERLAEQPYAVAIASMNRAMLSLEQWQEAGGALLSDSRLGEAVALYDDAIDLHPDSASLRSARGVARLITGRDGDARADFARAIQLDADDHVAALFFTEAEVRFSIRRYQSAEQVAVVGNFAGDGDQTVPLRKAGGLWTGAVRAAPGKHWYALRVDDTWVIDVDNPWIEKPGEYLKSVVLK